MQQWEVEWSANQFALMKIGGIWGVPRSGLVFLKTNDHELRLYELMPWTEDMGRAFTHGFDVPPGPHELRQYQQMDFEIISSRFQAAGIDVTDPQQLLKD